MKKFITVVISMLLASFTAQATSANYNNAVKPFIFVEAGIEFAVFQDGQFDFNRIQTNNVNVNIHTRNIDFSFNSGHNYDAYVQYDDYGAVVQIERTPIFYDYYGRVRRIGNVQLQYNSYGYASRIGNLHVVYNNYGAFSHCSGYVNNYSIDYGYRPHHSYYRVPTATRCIVNANPYRRYYNETRCDYATYRRNYNAGHYRKAYATRHYRTPSRTVIHHRNYDNGNRNYRNNNTSRKYTNNNHKTVARSTNNRNYTPRATKTNRNYNSRATTTNRNYNSRSNTTNRSYSRKATPSRTQSKRAIASTSNSGYVRR